MQEALKNENYKKIRDAVIKNRHPEAESLERALVLETKYADCLYYFNVNSRNMHLTDRNGNIIEYVTKTGLEMADLCGQYHKKYSVVKNFTINIKEDLILGRPITLEDVLSLLNNKPWENRGWIQSFKIQKTVNKGQYYIDIADKDYAYCGLCFWQLKKPLHEQTPETWQKIASLINISFFD